ncbi:unnamed protein product [Mycena citricolor]|uniref:Velvet domain-containing protein n=1 Tax=Mycena citricolor TaxID=2018698 RepID=A0AAD2Q555_9AGAR|nr:unnamed protein product [Mycena citricolor]CAK5275337.1 unnamed protein product [Mycena citricolor]
MIQHLSPRKIISEVASVNQTGMEQWGRWVGRHHYSLEMVQHPLRARMCGFGDKDRRPLAPAAVARLVVKREDGTPLDVDDLDYSFFLVTVDLWSEDGVLERNLVLHPTAERYPPAQAPKQRRARGGSTAAPSSSNSRTYTPTPTPAAAQFSGSSPHTGPPGSNYSNPNYYTAQSPAPVGTSAFSSPILQAQPPPLSSTHPTWGYSSTASTLQADRANPGYSVPALPPIQSFSPRSGPESQPWNPAHPASVPEPTYRPWGTDTHTSYPDPYAGPSTSQQQYDPALLNANPGPYPPAPPAAQPAHFRMPYVRTLIGPLSSNGYRLLDEHRKAGIFFLFQDLSVRTEGTFRLRLRLMNIGGPPAPERGATFVSTKPSSVLSQIFSEQFTVYSAKRFPGVPETTALSIALGNQGLKLPLRNRNKRRRGDGSDDDSDGD